MNSEDLVSIGKILKPHGLKGELRVLNLSSFAERFKALRYVILCLGNRREEFIVESVRFHKNFLLFKLKGIDSKEMAEKWRGADVMIKEKDVWKKGENFYFYHELIGLKCFLPRGEYLGIVDGIEEIGENINLIIKEKDGYEHSVPFAKEFIIVEKGEKIIVKPIPGLLSKK